MQVNIVKVNGIFWSGDASSVTAPGAEGELTILPNHVPLVSSLRKGRLIVKQDGKQVFTHEVERGVLEITGKTVTMLL